MKRIWKAQAILIAFWCACGVTLYLALAPAEPAMAWLGNDKVQHAAAFASLAVLARLAFPKWPILRGALFLAGFGAGIELLQALPLVHRDAELADWIADLFGLAMASLASCCVCWFRTQLAT
jgi:hypothetical protein